MNQFLLPLIFVLAFLAVATLAQGVFSIVSSAQARTQRVNRRLTYSVGDGILFGREVPEEGGARVVRTFGDLVDGRRLEALGLEELDGRPDELVVSLTLLPLAQRR